MSKWLEGLPVKRLAWVQELAIARKLFHRYPFKEKLLREYSLPRVVEPSTLQAEGLKVQKPES